MEELEDELPRWEEECEEAAMTLQEADKRSDIRRITHMDDSPEQWDQEKISQWETGKTQLYGKLLHENLEVHRNVNREDRHFEQRKEGEWYQRWKNAGQEDSR